MREAIPQSDAGGGTAEEGHLLFDPLGALAHGGGGIPLRESRLTSYGRGGRPGIRHR
jgi:hypothetical protein